MATSTPLPHPEPARESYEPTPGSGLLKLTADEKAVLSELLEAERAKLLVEIRHTDYRAYRQGLRQRLEIVENLIHRCCAP
jgi:hypothetical protein